MKHCSIIIFLDLSTAFDTIDHSLLIRRLQNIDTAVTVLDWVISYLDSRTYSVCIDSYKTKPRIISHGVPQGSVLAPILFNIYLSTLLDIFDRYPDINFHTYADDIQIYCNLPDPSTNISILNNCLDEISGWLASNSLSLNTNKTTVPLIKVPTTSTNIPSIRSITKSLNTLPPLKTLVSSSIQNYLSLNTPLPSQNPLIVNSILFV